MTPSGVAPAHFADGRERHRLRFDWRHAHCDCQRATKKPPVTAASLRHWILRILGEAAEQPLVSGLHLFLQIFFYAVNVNFSKIYDRPAGRNRLHCIFKFPTLRTEYSQRHHWRAVNSGSAMNEQFGIVMFESVQRK